MTKTAFLVLLAVSWSASGCRSGESVQITDAWIRALPPTMKITAAYMTIQNDGPQDVTLLGASCDVAESVQIHETTITDGVVQMRQRPQLSIRAGSALELRPGGAHLMLLGLHRPLNSGQVVPLTLRFADGERTVQATVQRGDEVEAQ